MSSLQCLASTKKGTRCTRTIGGGEICCWQHKEGAHEIVNVPVISPILSTPVPIINYPVITPIINPILSIKPQLRNIPVPPVIGSPPRAYRPLSPSAIPSVNPTSEDHLIQMMQTCGISQSTLWTISHIVDECPPYGWSDLFSSSKHILHIISEKIDTLSRQTQTRWVPDKSDLFRAYHLTPLDKVKVVIIAQDPYYSIVNNESIAIGLAFAVRKGVKIGGRVASSLVNIYKELANEYPTFQTPTHGDLTYWAQQGVLLLNTSLTTLAGQPNAHKGYWDSFIQNTLNIIARQRPNTIYLLWGNEAKKVVKHVGEHATILSTSHPSPLGAHKGFLGSGIFQQCNNILISRGEQVIDWQIPL